MTKKTGGKSVKKILQKDKIYDTLYTKLVAFLERGKSLTFEPPKRIGRMWEEIRASTSNGDIFFKKNSRQICTAAAKLTL